MVLKTIRYFNFFNYSPSFEEVYNFLEKKSTKKKVEETLKSLEDKNKIKKEKDLNNVTRYTLHVTRNNTVGEYSINKSKVKTQKSEVEKYNEKYFFSQKKLQNWRFRLYIKILSVFPQIKLVGLSGSLAMMNAGEDDDIDLFIITSKNRLFTGRFIAIILAKILMIHRSYLVGYKLQVASYTNKICLNLFFDERNLVIPKFKKNVYVAHEVIQMKPIFNKDNIYERFLRANSWVFKIFPNAKNKLKVKSQKSKIEVKIQKFLKIFEFLILNFLAVMIEKSLKSFQMYFVNKRKTTELITSTQLWFHPEDFYDRIKKIRK